MVKNFRSVAVREKVIGAEIFVELSKLQVAAWLFSRAGCAGFAIAYDRLTTGNKIGLREWTQSEDYAGGVATGISHELSGSDSGGIYLRQTVNGLAHTTGVRRR